MVVKKSNKKNILLKALLILTLTAITVIIILPVYFVISTSLKTYEEYVRNPIGLNFSAISISNYTDVLNSTNILTAFGNSIAITAVSVLCAVIFSAIGSFAIAVINFKGSKFFYGLCVLTMFFTGELTYVPLYMLYSKLGMLNTYWVLLIPCFVGFQSLGIMLGTNYLKGIPKEIHEAAIMDGASLPWIFFKVDLPLMRPTLSLIAVMSFQSAWSEFFWPMITTMGNKDIQTLPLKIMEFNAADATMFGQYCAGLTIMTIPMIIVYILFSKYFMEGMTAGSVKS